MLLRKLVLPPVGIQPKPFLRDVCFDRSEILCHGLCPYDFFRFADLLGFLGLGMKILIDTIVKKLLRLVAFNVAFARLLDFLLRAFLIRGLFNKFLLLVLLLQLFFLLVLVLAPFQETRVTVRSMFTLNGLIKLFSLWLCLNSPWRDVPKEFPLKDPFKATSSIYLRVVLTELNAVDGIRVADEELATSLDCDDAHFVVPHLDKAVVTDRDDEL